MPRQLESSWLKCPVPLADALIAAQAVRFPETIVSSDHHYNILGVKKHVV
jgi:predicted nucleic acid-binding protein